MGCIDFPIQLPVGDYEASTITIPPNRLKSLNLNYPITQF